MMTREEAIELVCYGDWLNILMPHLGDNDINRLAEAMCIIGNALRPVSREQVEKVWTGCEKCHNQDNWPSWIEKGFVFCPKCGTPLASWAWEKQMERLEALNENRD